MVKNNHTPVIRFPGFTEEWEQRKLGDAVDFFDEKRIPIDSEKRKKGQYPYYGATGIIDYVEDYIFEGEYVLLAEDGANITMRNRPISYLTKGKFWINNHAHIMKMKSGSNIYLVQLLEKQNYEKYNSGTAQPKLNGQVVKNIILNFPYKEEQTKIGAFFKQLSDTIDLHHQELTTLKQTKQGFLQKMFPKEGEGVPEVRFPGFTDDWEQRKLDKILKERKVKQKISKEVPLLAFASGQGVIDRSERKTNNRDFLTKDSTKKTYLLTKYDDIVYNPSNLKYGAIDRNKHGQGVISPIYVTFETDEIPPFIELIVKSENFKQHALQYEEGTVTKRQSVKPENLLCLNVVLPNSKDEQIKIGNFFKQLDDMIDLHQRELDALKETKKAFLQKMFI